MVFRFRPEAVLQLRRREEDAARDVVSRATAARDRAVVAHAAATDVLNDARSAMLGELAAGATVGRLAWHRRWIERLAQDVAVRARAIAHAGDVVAAAEAVRRDAMQRRRVLERLRDRAWRRFEQARDRIHLHEMNELARLRYVAARADHEENDR